MERRYPSKTFNGPTNGAATRTTLGHTTQAPETRVMTLVSGSNSLNLSKPGLKDQNRHRGLHSKLGTPTNGATLGGAGVSQESMLHANSDPRAYRMISLFYFYFLSSPKSQMAAGE